MNKLLLPKPPPRRHIAWYGETKKSKQATKDWEIYIELYKEAYLNGYKDGVNSTK